MVLVSVLLVGSAVAELAFVPANVLVPIMYPAVVAACLWTRNIRVLWGTVLLAVLMMVAAVMVWLLYWSASLMLRHLLPAMARVRVRVVAWARTDATRLHRWTLALLDPRSLIRED